MILLVGYVAPLDYEVCRVLRSARESVRVLVPPDFPPVHTAALRDIGAEVVAGDPRHPATLVAACQDADAVIVTMAAVPGWGTEKRHIPDRAFSRALVELTSAIRMRRVVALVAPQSFRKETLLLDARNELSSRLERHGMDYTVLEVNLCMEAWLVPAQGFDYENGAAALFGGGDMPVAWISSRDVAEMVSSCISGPNRGRHIQLNGPENLTQLEVVGIFEDISGKSFEVRHVDLATLQREYESARNPAAQADAALKWECAHGCPMEISAATRPPLALTAVRDYAARVLGRRVAAGVVNYSPD